VIGFGLQLGRDALNKHKFKVGKEFKSNETILRETKITWLRLVVMQLTVELR
jgi:hypothetical protein